MDRLDPALSERVKEAAEVFHEAFDAAEAQPSARTYDELREATDRLMRAAGRVLIDIERSVQG